MPRRSSVVREITILYGVLIRIGGYEHPRAYIQFLDGRKLSCSISSRALAIAMAPRLYQSIGVRGTAAWDARDKSLRAFHVEELLPYQDAVNPTTIQGLADLVGRYYDQMDGH